VHISRECTRVCLCRKKSSWRTTLTASLQHRQEIVFIGAGMDEVAISSQLDSALLTPEEMAKYVWSPELLVSSLPSLGHAHNTEHCSACDSGCNVRAV
jgi:Cobalamin synthesis protein cobW C-terminal domain